MTIRKLGFCLTAVAVLAGCTHLGPRTVAVDRFDYSTAIADSWKQQTLLNILEAPAAHLKDHSVLPGFDSESADKSAQPVRIRSGTEKPAAAYAAVQYLDHWFWVDNGDWRTKRAMSAIMFFFTLADTGASDKLPLITIPAQ